jgi:hypothetical protein
MRFNHGYTVSSAALLIMAGHIAILPYIFFFTERITISDKIDVAFLIAPLTASAFVATIRYSIDNRKNDIFAATNTVNGLFVAAALSAIVPFLAAIFILIGAYDRGASYDIEFVKRGIGVIEIFFGGSFGLFVSSIFGPEKPPGSTPRV